MPKYTVVCEWSDAGPNGGYAVEDADEVVVHAESASEAITKAKKKWRLTIGAEWPNCRLIRSFVLTPARASALL